MTRLCRNFCGECEQCKAALAEAEALDTVLASLPEEDLESLYRQDPDDPRSFALNHRGEP